MGAINIIVDIRKKSLIIGSDIYVMICRISRRVGVRSFETH
jgi:hypothetical protein